MAEYGPQPLFKEKLAELEARKRDRAGRSRRLDRLKGSPPGLPDSVADLRRLFEEKASNLAEDTPEFGDLLRLVVPEIHVYLVRLIDGGHLLPRARVRLTLGGLVPDADRAPGLNDLLTRELTLDLFEPPQRKRIRVEAARLAALGHEQRQIARMLPESVTQPAVSNALILDRMMRERNLETPYEFVVEPPKDYGKLRRHENAKYRFEPAADYVQPPI
jgi:site-specific DNA recombinase